MIAAPSLQRLDPVQSAGNRIKENILHRRVRPQQAQLSFAVLGSIAFRACGCKLIGSIALGLASSCDAPCNRPGVFPNGLEHRFAAREPSGRHPENQT